jgi:hypothetical protein
VDLEREEVVVDDSVKAKEVENRLDVSFLHFECSSVSNEAK